ncbi:unnamed protein product [Dibothriocephalus latus]|uniref:Uncharacterized protein n=1 Tax=Dibothriocephalus latus TaxID=60516 RepID=A0A3P7NIG9_DIBLA|nr:unnamed protein product [Dibothriocephalus latus]
MDAVGLVGDQQSQPFVLDDDCSQFYRTGGYWLMATQPMNGLFPISRIGGIAFDPCEELTWCVTRTVSPPIPPSLPPPPLQLNGFRFNEAGGW